MKLPKLKHYCTALTPDHYAEFERTRELEVVESVTVNAQTGETQGRTWIPLIRGVDACDTYFRMQLRYHGVLYVLRIPAEHIDRTALTVVDPAGIFEYRATLTVPHCGVERFELDLSNQAQTQEEPEVLSSSIITISI